MSLAKNVEFLRHLPKLNGFNGLGDMDAAFRAAPDSPLVEITRNSAPIRAHLRMFAFVPEHLQRAPALVVVLHGCGQTAAGYDFGAGWSTLAKRYGFALLMPEQQASNNANTCFNWFNPEDTARGSGEACSIRQMIAQMVNDHKIDSQRIFVTGLSAGGAMTSVMLATYPEVFAARRRHRRTAVRRRQQCARSAERHDAVAIRVRPANWAIWCATRPNHKGPGRNFGVAWQRRSHRQSGQCQRDRQAVARRAPAADRADVGRGGRRLSARGLVERRWRDRRRILHHHRHGPRHAARNSRQ